MSETSTLTQQAETVRTETLSILEKLNEKAGHFELPKPPEALENYRQRLAENTYKVLVMGEAKQGKSSFVNALIGRTFVDPETGEKKDLLPTDVGVSTNQVFAVRPAEQEGYRLRFEDGSAREITREDLWYYGSEQYAEQLKKDAEERFRLEKDDGHGPRLDEIVRWIEVDTPTIRFLPEGVSLYDTPGLGSLYAGHTQVTQRFVPEADAVIFVIDSKDPITDRDLETIETVLEVTPDIFFVQTKIDMYRKEEWQSLQRRNQEILEGRFGGCLTDTSVWPISSPLLMDAASESGQDAEEDLAFSRHPELEQALKAFLLRVSGWRRSAVAMLAAESYYSSARNTLSTRLAGLTEDAKKRSEMQQRAADLSKKFNDEWGQRGHKRKELVDETRSDITIGRQSIERALSGDGEIVLDQKEKIDAVTSLKEANALGDGMYGDVVSAATKRWQEICANIEARCVDRVGPFLEDADALGGTLGTDLEERKPLEGFKEDWYVRIKALRMDMFVGTGLAAALFFTPVPFLAPIPLLWSLWRGWRGGKEVQVREAKQKLHIHLSRAVMPNVKKCFLDPDISATSHRRSVVQEYFASVEKAMIEQVQKIAKQKEKEAKAEFDRLVEAGELDEQQRKDRVEHTRRQLAQWDEIGESIESAGAKLNALDQPPSVPAAG